MTRSEAAAPTTSSRRASRSTSGSPCSTRTPARRSSPAAAQVGLVGVTGRSRSATGATTRRRRRRSASYDGVRWSIPGDYATVDARRHASRCSAAASACINTGGEKVYPEEVEVVLREHPERARLRRGRRARRAVRRDGGGGGGPRARRRPSTRTTLDEFTRTRLAGYKRPRRYVVIDDLDRSAAGKANLRYLRDLAAEHVGRHRMSTRPRRNRPATATWHDGAARARSCSTCATTTSGTPATPPTPRSFPLGELAARHDRAPHRPAASW